MPEFLAGVLGGYTMRSIKRSLLKEVYRLEWWLLLLKQELNTPSPATPFLWQVSGDCERSLKAICLGIQALEIKMGDTQTMPSTAYGEMPVREPEKP